MDEIAKTILENQVLETLAKVRRVVASDMAVQFEETREPQVNSGASCCGEALLELIGAYVKGQKIAVLAWVKHWVFPENAEEEFWSRLIERTYAQLTSRIPDLKWVNLEIYFLDAMEPLEKAAFLSQDFP